MTPVASGIVGNRNQLATYINMGVIAALLMYPLIQGAVPRLLLMAGVPILLLTLALTLSRTGLIVLLVTLFFVWYRLARERGFLVLLGSTLACLTLVFFLPGDFWQRAGTIVPSIERQENTFGKRVDLWQVGLRVIQDHPVLGVGPGNFILASARYAEGGLTGQRLNSHNTFVGTAAESGLIGMALFLSVVVSAIVATRRGVRIARQAGERALALMGITAETMIWAVMMSGITGNVEALKVLWIGLGMCVAFVSVVDSTLGREVQPAAPPESGSDPVSVPE
jgi:putative inorganic carbon (HCO3(-)) transporter